MKQAQIRFYAELNDLLFLPRGGLSFTHDFEAAAWLKDAIEAFGGPHIEVDLILANGEPAAFSRLLQHGDRISVWFSVRWILPGSRIFNRDRKARSVSSSTRILASSQPTCECWASTA
jgi:hypothetical protein